MNQINNKEYEVVKRLPVLKRYEYFIKKVADAAELWGLSNNTWATAQNSDGEIVIPFWPKKEFAEACATGEWEKYSPKSIDLKDFLEKWLPGMLRDGYRPAIFYNANDQGVVVDIERLKNDLLEELEKY